MRNKGEKLFSLYGTARDRVKKCIQAYKPLSYQFLQNMKNNSLGRSLCTADSHTIRSINFFPHLIHRIRKRKDIGVR